MNETVLNVLNGIILELKSKIIEKREMFRPIVSFENDYTHTMGVYIEDDEPKLVSYGGVLSDYFEDITLEKINNDIDNGIAIDMSFESLTINDINTLFVFLG